MTAVSGMILNSVAKNRPRAVRRCLHYAVTGHRGSGTDRADRQASVHIAATTLLSCSGFLATMIVVMMMSLILSADDAESG